MAIIAPSLLSADFLNLQRDIDMLNRSRAEWFHLDIMDGRFVPNISYGPMIVKYISSATEKYCDTHLMIEEPEKYVDEFRKAGADCITVHLEACRHLHRNVQQIKNTGADAGVAINPHTPVWMLRDIIADIDLVLVMSVNPGFGGQKFIENSLAKIEETRNLVAQKNSKARIEVDGGVSLANAAALVSAGADVLVAGNAVFSAEDPEGMIKKLFEAK